MQSGSTSLLIASFSVRRGYVESQISENADEFMEEAKDWERFFRKAPHGCRTSIIGPEIRK